MASLYLSLLSIGYYGLLRVGKLCEGTHTIKAANVHVARNKQKMLFILYSSKTHYVNKPLQKIKITSSEHSEESSLIRVHRNFCPFEPTRKYITLHGNYRSINKQFYIFHDGSPVKPVHVRTVLHSMIQRLGLDSSLYDVHSLRSGRTSDLIRYGYSIEEVKRIGHWKLNAVYKYIKN